MSSTTNEKHPDSVARGERIKRIRQSLGMSMDDFAKLVKVSRSAMHYWQHGTEPGLSPSGAESIINALKSRDIECSFEWLWNGIGEAPHNVMIIKEKPFLPQASNDTLITTQDEISFFIKSEKGAVVAKIKTNHLSPFFEFNDLVGGVWQPFNTLRSDGFCIVQLDGENEVRWLKRIESTDNQVLLSHSPLSTQTEKTTLEEAAPMIRLWRLR